MDFMEAVARQSVCEWGDSDHCLDGCKNYIWVDPRTTGKKGKGPGTTGQRTLCSLLNDLRDQVEERD